MTFRVHMCVGRGLVARIAIGLGPALLATWLVAIGSMHSHEPSALEPHGTHSCFLCHVSPFSSVDTDEPCPVDAPAEFRDLARQLVEAPAGRTPETSAQPRAPPSALS